MHGNLTRDTNKKIEATPENLLYIFFFFFFLHRPGDWKGPL